VYSANPLGSTLVSEENYYSSVKTHFYSTTKEKEIGTENFSFRFAVISFGFETSCWNSSFFFLFSRDHR
jgi:hypothetical protein